MKYLTIKRQIQVIAIFTDSLRKELLDGVQKRLDETEKALRQQDIEMNRALISNPHPQFMQEIRAHFGKQKEGIFGLQNQMASDLDKIKKMNNGDRIHYCNVEGEVEWKLGEKLTDALWCQAVIEDGRLVEITHEDPQEVMAKLAQGKSEEAPVMTLTPHVVMPSVN